MAALEDGIYLQADEGYAALLVLLLDLSADFDMVDYATLLKCLIKEIRVRGKMFEWFITF